MKIALPISMVLFVGTASLSVGAEGKKTRDEMVLEDRDVLEKSEEWIYNDLEKAKEAARAAKKPMLIVFRCIP